MKLAVRLYGIYRRDVVGAIPYKTDSRGRLSLQIGRGYPSPTFYLFTLHSSLFTLHSTGCRGRNPLHIGRGYPSLQEKKETTKSWFLLFLVFLCFATCCAVCFNDCIISNDFSKGVYIVVADICNNIIVNCICLAV